VGLHIISLKSILESSLSRKRGGERFKQERGGEKEELKGYGAKRNKSKGK